MPTNERNSRIKRDRRTLIGALNMVWPGSLPGEELFMIVLAVNPEYTRTFLVRDMTYLNAKGYAGFKGLHGIDAMRITVADCAFFLTAAGTDVANQMVIDPTLDV